MISNDEKNEMLVTVLTDLAEICTKLANNPVLSNELRIQARQFREAYDCLVPKGNFAQHLMGEELIVKIAR